MMDAAAKKMGWHPYPGLRVSGRVPIVATGVHVLRVLLSTGCFTNAKVQTNVDYIPPAEKTKNLTVVPQADVMSIEVDSQGRVSGALYLKGGREYFQPAKLVLLSAVLLRELTDTPALDVEGLSQRPLEQPRAGRPALIGHGTASAGATGWFPGTRMNRYSGTLGQFTGVDDSTPTTSTTPASASSAAACARHDGGKPIGTANAIPPSQPRWGSGWKAWLKENADSVAGVGAQLEVLSTKGTTSTSTRQCATRSDVP